MFHEVTGYRIGEYMRLRRLSEAATMILGGADIQQTAFSFGFSSQQVFTRCFRSQFGTTPALMRDNAEVFGKLVPKLTIRDGGNKMKLVADYNWKNGDAVDALMRKVLDDEALELVHRVVQEPVPESERHRETVENLLSVRAL
jgi:AraC-like DNA-binding protein